MIFFADDDVDRGQVGVRKFLNNEVTKGLIIEVRLRISQKDVLVTDSEVRHVGGKRDVGGWV